MLFQTSGKVPSEMKQAASSSRWLAMCACYNKTAVQQFKFGQKTINHSIGVTQVAELIQG